MKTASLELWRLTRNPTDRTISKLLVQVIGVEPEFFSAHTSILVFKPCFQQGFLFDNLDVLGVLTFDLSA